MRTKNEVLSHLRTMLNDVIRASAAGVAQGRIARAHGYVDGYMRALLDLGVTSREELLQVVASEREHVSGPAVRVLELESERVAAA